MQWHVNNTMLSLKCKCICVFLRYSDVLLLYVAALFGVGEAEWDRGSEAVSTEKVAGSSFMTIRGSVFVCHSLLPEDCCVRVCMQASVCVLLHTGCEQSLFSGQHLLTGGIWVGVTLVL